MDSVIWRCDLVPQYKEMEEDILLAIRSVLGSGRYILSENVASFEREFADYIGTRHGVGVANGFDALVLALRALGVRAGDEVITTPFTAIPTYSAIRAVGAKPIFSDVDPATFLMQIEQVPGLVSERTKAVLPVHLFGNCVDVARLRELLGPDIPILEDCAQAHGAVVEGRRAGSLGTISAFSFFPTKNLGGYGDGGMVLSDSDVLTKQVRKARMYGMVNKDEIQSDGVNSRLDELQASVLRVKLRHLDRLNQRRSEIARLYSSSLDERYFRMQAIPANVRGVHHVFCILVPERRDSLVAYLAQKGIQTNVYYPFPLYRQTPYRNDFGHHPALEHAEDLCRRIVALPFYPEINMEVVKVVSDELNRWGRTEFAG